MLLRLISLCVLPLVIFGCTGALRNQQLEKVAKDWALVIRASQVIPVYPLTEDLQPGDVLLVSTPIEDQVRTYREKGFLALDQHLVRLYSSDFTKFYNSRYGISDEMIPPAMWQTLDREGKHQWGWRHVPHFRRIVFRRRPAPGSIWRFRSKVCPWLLV